MLKRDTVVKLLNDLCERLHSGLNICHYTWTEFAVSKLQDLCKGCENISCPHLNIVAREVEPL